MKKKVFTILAIAVISLVGFVGAKPALAQTQFWSGTAQVTVTEALVVKIGDAVLADGFQFQPVDLKVGGTKVYTFTVQNTGDIAQLVKPIATPSTPDVIASWTNGAGLSITPASTGTFVLTLTAVNAATGITVNIGFTRE